MDGDGLIEIGLAARSKVYVFDPKDGTTRRALREKGFLSRGRQWWVGPVPLAALQECAVDVPDDIADL